MTALAIRTILGRDAVHPFPARMAPPVALKSLKSVPRGSTILDPMMGSGTVLAIARSLGHRAVGIDVDPLAVVNARVWTTALNKTLTTEAAARVLHMAVRREKRIASVDAYPDGADDETRAFVAYWFDLKARRQLAALSQQINELGHDAIRNALWCAFSRLIIAKAAGASRALDLSHSRPHRHYEHAPVLPFDRFSRAVAHVVANCIGMRDEQRGPAARARLGDARKIGLPRASVDLVLTSPPYLNAIDYLRCSKFSLVWMGFTIPEIRAIRAMSIGAEVSHADPGEAASLMKRMGILGGGETRMDRIVARFASDLRSTLSEVRRVLKPGGGAVYIVGESTVRGRFVPTARIVSQLASECGLRQVARTSRGLPANRRYLPPPSATSGSMRDRMSREVILTFECM